MSGVAQKQAARKVEPVHMEFKWGRLEPRESSQGCESRRRVRVRVRGGSSRPRPTLLRLVLRHMIGLSTLASWAADPFSPARRPGSHLRPAMTATLLRPVPTICASSSTTLHQLHKHRGVSCFEHLFWPDRKNTHNKKLFWQKRVAVIEQAYESWFLGNEALPDASTLGRVVHFLPQHLIATAALRLTPPAGGRSWAQPPPRTPEPASPIGPGPRPSAVGRHKLAEKGDFIHTTMHCEMKHGKGYLIDPLVFELHGAHNKEGVGRGRATMRACISAVLPRPISSPKMPPGRGGGGGGGLREYTSIAIAYAKARAILAEEIELQKRLSISAVEKVSNNVNVRQVQFREAS
ncbi:MAG: hypothetical protein FRX49_01329 [Trebouxia sp. A1-2]|nr:MAG: hypothetical protein FRX49_01329 [Trebouxia sp. A1-2]